MNRIFVISLFALSASVHAATVVSINWTASTDNGFGLQNGSLLPVGNELRLGVFDFPNATLNADVQALLSQNKLGELASHFTVFDTAFIGIDAFSASLGTVPLAQRSGLFEAASGNIEVPTGSPLFGKALFIWAFKTSNDGAVSGDYGNVLQTGIFGSTAANWGFPGDNPGFPYNNGLDITNLSDGAALASSARVVFGGFGTSSIPMATSDNHVFTLAPAPEPASVALIAIGLGILGTRRRRG